MQEKIEGRHKEIAHIQNTIWAAYKDFLSDQNVKAYTQKVSLLTKKYQDMGDPLLTSFAENEAATWCPVINGFAEDFRNGEKT